MLDQVRALLIDLDGVLYVEDEPIAGAREAVERLRAAGLALRFVTNTTARSRSHTLEKLRRLGFAVGDDGARHARRARGGPLRTARASARGAGHERGGQARLRGARRG